MRTLLLAAPLMLAAANPPAAEQPAPSRSVEVSYRDLDLTRPQDRATLDRRLRRAAHLVCRPSATDGRWVPPGPLDWIARAPCERATVAHARTAAAAAVVEAGRRLLVAQVAPR